MECQFSARYFSTRRENVELSEILTVGRVYLRLLEKSFRERFLAPLCRRRSFTEMMFSLPFFSSDSFEKRVDSAAERKPRGLTVFCIGTMRPSDESSKSLCGNTWPTCVLARHVGQKATFLSSSPGPKSRPESDTLF